MSLHDLEASLTEVPLTAAYRDVAVRKLEEARAMVNRSAGRSAGVRLMALTQLRNAEAEAEEWGVLGSSTPHFTQRGSARVGAALILCSAFVSAAGVFALLQTVFG